MAPGRAMLVALLLSGATVTGMAQAPTPPGKMPKHQEGMKGMSGMSGMMKGPHHVLAMAYRDNLATFARALRDQASHAPAVNLDLARPAVAEMRRSFGLMQEHHQAQMAMMGDGMMGDGMKAPAPEAMQQMESRLRTLNEHLTALEAEVAGSAPDPKKVSAHATEILKLCAGMSAMPAKAKPHNMN